MVFALFTGVLVDKFQKKKILIFTQILSMLQAFVLFALVYFGMVEYWHILILALILGCTNSLDMPARQAYVMELVGRKDVINAVGLNSAVFNLARIVGPAIAAIMMTGMGIAWCFLINGISFIAVIAALLKIRHDPDRLSLIRQKKEISIFRDTKDGLIYIYKTPILFKTALIILFVTIVGFNYNVLIPVFAKAVLGLQEKGFGFLLSALGVGSLIGALSVSVGTRPEPKTTILKVSSVLLGCALFVLGFTRDSFLTAFLLVLCGLFNLWFFTMANSILQLNSSNEYRGRVMGVYTLVFAGAMPIGNFICGYVAEKIGAATTFSILGTIIALTVMSVHTVRGSAKFTGSRKDSPV